ncbi:MAG TPA: Uma2 family endonuclease, partial [Polyangiaceae bacterium]
METLGMALDGPLEPEAWEEIEPPDVSGIVTEDDTPVDNLYSEKQQRLLVEPLHAAWTPDAAVDGSPRVFLASANVGLFPSVREPPLVPDAFLSMDVTPRPNLWEKRNRVYFFWEFGKPPEVVVEVVSNRDREEGEPGEKKRRYARMRIAHYV